MVMQQKPFVEELVAIITPCLSDLGFELVDLEFQHEGREHFLRLFIDTPTGVTLDNCAEVSREVGALLEVEDVISQAYRLEVSSPGIDRLLKRPADFERFAGQRVKIKSHEALDPDGRGHTRKTFTGTLIGLRDGHVVVQQLDAKGGEVAILLADLVQARLDPEF